MWTPDIYQGAPAPVTAFVATVSKGAMVALLLRYFRHVSLTPHDTVWIIFAIIAAASMIAGNLLALLQKQRQAAAGLLLDRPPRATSWSPFSRSARRRRWPSVFYLVAYFVTTLAAFGIVARAVGRRARRRRDRTTTAASAPGGRCWPRPSPSLCSRWPAFPLTAGFMGKFYVVERRRRLAAVVAAGRARRLEHHRPLLLHPHRRRHVRAGAGAPRPSAGAAPGRDRRQPGERLGAGRGHGARAVPRHLPDTADQTRSSTSSPACRNRRGLTPP